MRYDAPSTLPLELAVVEICEESAAPAPVAEAPPPMPAPAANTARQAPASQAPRPAPPPRERQPERPPQRERPAPASAGARSQPTVPPAPGQRGDGSGRTGGESNDLWVQWNNTVKALSRHKGRKYNLGALLRDCKVNSISLDDKTLVLPFTNKANLERMQEELEDPASRKRLTEALTQSFGEGCDYQLTLANGQQSGGSATNPAQQSSLVRAAQGMGAKIIQVRDEDE